MKKIKLPEESELYKLLLGNDYSVKKSLVEYIIPNKNSLGYEFSYSKKTVPVFITGNENEKNIPLTRIPVTIKVGDTTYIVSNLSGSVKADLSNGIMTGKRTDLVDFELVRNILMSLTVEDKDNITLATATAQLASFWISESIKSSLRLDHILHAEVYGAIMIYFIRNFIADATIESATTKLLNSGASGYAGNYDRCKLYAEELFELSINDPLSKYINKMCSDHKILSVIDTKTISATITNNWFSGADSSSTQILLAIENFHTMASILYHSLTTVTGKKTQLGKLLKDNARRLKTEPFQTTIEGLIRDTKIY